MANNAEKKALIALYEQKMREAGSSDWWVSFSLKSAGEIVELTDGNLFVITKGRIEKDFPFYRDIYGYEDAEKLVSAARTSTEYFKAENLSGLRQMIDILESGDELWLSPEHGVMRIIVPTIYEQPNDGDIWMTPENRRRILAGYYAAYAAFEKRLETYLKKYGLAHIRAWSWSD